MSTANGTVRGATYGGFLTLVIEAMRRSARLADERARHRQLGERYRGDSALDPAARAPTTAVPRPRSLGAPVVAGGAVARGVRTSPLAEPIGPKAPIPGLPVILNSVGGSIER
jgi:hypothetical protein